MATRREWILRATVEAARIREQFPQGRRTSFDIVGATSALGLPLLYRPTKGLLGATVVLDDGTLGILVTTNRGLGAQRFTLAHELGHILLNHAMHFDPFAEEVGSLEEVIHTADEQAADAFASELLTPQRSIIRVATQCGWGPSELTTPACVYQLSLRLGVSFRAMCWSLVGANLVAPNSARQIAKTTDLQQLKRSLDTQSLLEDPWADVWRLTAADSGSVIEAGPGDVYVAELSGHPSAGFLWSLDQDSHDFEVSGEIDDDRPEYGSETSRILFLRASEKGRHRLDLINRRPWNNETEGRVEIDVVNFGKEEAGLPRQVRELRIAAGASA